MSALRALLRLASRLALAPFAAAVVFLLSGGVPTWSTAAYALLGFGLVVGLATLPDTEIVGFESSGAHRPAAARVRRPRGVTRASVALLALVALVRVLVAGTGATMIDDGRFGTSLLGGLVDEGDLAQAGSRVLFGAGALVDDARATPPAMRGAYARMRSAHGDVVSPVVPTFLGLEPSPSGLDMLVLHETRETPRVGVVFLHGLAGSFALPCWTVASAFAEVDEGIVTACPSRSASPATGGRRREPASSARPWTRSGVAASRASSSSVCRMAALASLAARAEDARRLPRRRRDRARVGRRRRRRVARRPGTPRPRHARHDDVARRGRLVRARARRRARVPRRGPLRDARPRAGVRPGRPAVRCASAPTNRYFAKRGVGVAAPGRPPPG